MPEGKENDELRDECWLSNTSTIGDTTNASPSNSTNESIKLIGCSTGRVQSVYSLTNVWNMACGHQLIIIRSEVYKQVWQSSKLTQTIIHENNFNGKYWKQCITMKPNFRHCIYVVYRLSAKKKFVDFCFIDSSIDTLCKWNKVVCLPYIRHPIYTHSIIGNVNCTFDTNMLHSPNAYL